MEISGFNVESLNKTTVLKDVGEGYLLIVGPIDKDGSQTEPITIKRTVPDMDFYTVSENRLWGCSSKNHEIYASKLGSFRNFNCFDGVSSDSCAATIASDGDFTGAITYLGYVMFWKENAVYKVYGNRPSNFQIVEGMLRGVAKGCGKSLCIVNRCGGGAGSGIRRSRSGKDGKQILYFHGEGAFCLRHGKRTLAPGG